MSPLSPRQRRRSWPIVFRLLAGAAVVAAAACAPVSRLPEIDEKAAKAEREIQQELAFRQFYKNSRRVHAITYPILKAGAALCGDDIARGLGLLVVNKYFFKKDYRAAAEKAFGIGDGLKIAGVAPGSAGERAGARDGDALVTLNGWPVPTGEDALKTFHDKLNELAKQKADPVLAVGRDAAPVTLTIATDVVCNYGYEATEDSMVNANADGKDIHIAAGIIRFMEDDNELATVIGHEIAHNMMDHIPKGRANVAIGTVVDILFAGFGVNTQGAFGRLGGAAFSQEFEAEADYVGLYLAARAGFKTGDAPYLWRRMALNYPGNIKSNHAAAHPATPHRFLALEKTVGEIKAKQAAGKPLVPEKRDATTAPAAAAPQPQ